MKRKWVEEDHLRGRKRCKEVINPEFCGETENGWWWPCGCAFADVSAVPTRMPQNECESKAPQMDDAAGVVVRERINANGINSINISGHFRNGSYCRSSSELSHHSSPIQLFRHQTVVEFSESLLKGLNFPNVSVGQPVCMFTVSFRTRKIMLVNAASCKLLGYSADEFMEMNFSDLFAERHKAQVEALSDIESNDNNLFVYNGELVEFNGKGNTVVPALMWLKPLNDTNGVALATAKLVDRQTAKISLNSKGMIKDVDEETALLFQCDVNDVKGQNLKDIIPSAVFDESKMEEGVTSFIEHHKKEQFCTGLTLKTRQVFPLILHYEPDEDDTITAVIQVFGHLSGLIVIDKAGVIDDCNHQLVKMMFGQSQTELLGKHITKLIPDFCKDLVSVNSLASFSALTNSDLKKWDDPATHSEYFSAQDSSNAVIEYIAMLNAPFSPNNTQDLSESNTPHNLSELGIENETGSDPTTPVSHKQFEPCSNDITSNGNLTNGISELSDDEDDHDVILPQLSDHTYNICKEKVPPFFYPLEVALHLLDACEENSESVHISESVKRDEVFMCNGIALHFDDGDHRVLSPSCADISERSASPNEEQSLGNHVDDDSSDEADKFSLFDCGTPIHLEDTSNDVSVLQEVVDEAIKDLNLDGIQQGFFRSMAKHRDGALFGTDYSVKLVQLAGGRRLYLVWVCAAAQGDDLAGLESKTVSSVDMSLNCETSRRTSASLVDCIPDSELMKGQYGELYDNFQKIGSGAFGLVKIAREKNTGTSVVTKFIEKKKIVPALLMDDGNGGKIPLEIQILKNINHENIIKVLDVYENDRFHILVMEKFRNGLDLFDFINSTRTDETLNSYIFRQISVAVQYLQSQSIIHRDIKDENVILDDGFHVKLIDFGSATYIKDGDLFSTFYGTMQYCSPEVLKGNKYAGPEQEMWSLGVTLYTMSFSSCPFETIEETIKSNTLFDPATGTPATEELTDLLGKMLHRDLTVRCTIDDILLHPWITQPVQIENYSFHDIVAAGLHPKKSSSGSDKDVRGSTASDVTTNNSTTVENYDSDEVVNLEFITELTSCIPSRPSSPTLTTISSEAHQATDDLTDYDVDGFVDDENHGDLTDDEVVWADASMNL